MLIKRDTFWMISSDLKIAFYVIATLAIFIFAYGFFRRYKLWNKGRKERVTWGEVKANLSYFFSMAVKQEKIQRDKLFGFIHRFISYGFFILFIGTVLVFMDYDLHIPLLRGNFYLFYKLVLDLFGALFLIGLSVVLIVRIRKQRTRLFNTFTDQAFLWLLIIIGISGFILEGIRLAETKVSYAAWSPIGYAVSFLFQDLQNLPQIYTAFWFSHAIFAFLLISMVPYTKLFHFIMAPINMLLRPVKRPGEISSLYSSQITDFTNLQLMSTDACTECGRCDNQCPAYLGEKPLSPRSIVLKIRDNMATDKKILSFISADELESCTTCAACVEACPVSINQLDLIVMMRRGLLQNHVLQEQAENMLIRVEEQHNIWGKPWSERADWSRNLNVPRLDGKKGEEV
jgi:heterodisulfide reductase subunit C